MRVSIVGTGYVGLVAGACFADAGHHVICVDRDHHKIDQLKCGRVPIYEPGLEDLLKQCRSRIEFTTDLGEAVNASEVVFVAVGTPETADGSADMGPTLAVVEGICHTSKSKKYIVLKSTVPVGTANHLQRLCNERGSFGHEIINNPEFLREGSAIGDFLSPDRIVVGVRSPEAEELMKFLYAPFMKNGHPVIFMDNASAELTKYAANAFLSVKISFINELALLCDKMGADVNMVRKGFTSDKRINPEFFAPGVGYGGSCFPKDVKALIHSGESVGLRMDVVRAADSVNERQKVLLIEKIRGHFKGDITGKTFAMWGLSFKPRTDDVREAPSLVLISELARLGAKVVAYDPVASETARMACKVSFGESKSASEATEGADALIIVTEWNEFRNPDFAQLRENLKAPVIFDGRNIYDPLQVAEEGFKYYCVGRESLASAKG